MLLEILSDGAWEKKWESRYNLSFNVSRDKNLEHHNIKWSWELLSLEQQLAGFTTIEISADKKIEQETLLSE